MAEHEIAEKIRRAADKNIHFGSIIKSARKCRGLTQQQLADGCGLTRTSITNIECGRQNLTTQTVADIAAALGYRVKVRFELIHGVNRP